MNINELASRDFLTITQQDTQCLVDVSYKDGTFDFAVPALIKDDENRQEIAGSLRSTTRQIALGISALALTGTPDETTGIIVDGTRYKLISVIHDRSLNIYNIIIGNEPQITGGYTGVPYVSSD